METLFLIFYFIFYFLTLTPRIKIYVPKNHLPRVRGVTVLRLKLMLSYPKCLSLGRLILVMCLKIFLSLRHITFTFPSTLGCSPILLLLSRIIQPTLLGTQRPHLHTSDWDPTLILLCHNSASLARYCTLLGLTSLILGFKLMLSYPKDLSIGRLVILLLQSSRTGITIHPLEAHIIASTLPVRIQLWCHYVMAQLP